FSLTKAGEGRAAAPTVYGPGSWKARMTLLPGQSGGNCSKVVGPTTQQNVEEGVYMLNVAGDSFTADSSTGRMLTTAISTDGKIVQTFMSPNRIAFRMTGNAKTRDLEVMATGNGCRWKLTPE